MTSTKNLKIWTIITHALIVVGFGHGMLTLGLIEVFWFPYFTKEDFTVFLDSPFQTRLPMVGLLTLLGQAALTYSVLTKHARLALPFHLFGLLFLWLSMVYFVVDQGQEGDVRFGTLTALPFLFCTLIMFAGKPLKRLYWWALDE